MCDNMCAICDSMCEDYDLCEGCAAMPRDQVHDETHVFVKLKRQRNRHLDYQSGSCLEKVSNPSELHLTSTPEFTI